MKGKAEFTHAEAVQIEALITLKLKSSPDKQKGIREKIRKLGFYAADFNVGRGYTVADFRRVTRISKKETVVPPPPFIKPTVSSKAISEPGKGAASDERYILDLCDRVLNRSGMRQYRFDFLLGDTGRMLPVDIYYPDLKLVIEYRERQHSEEVKFFDKRITSSGISRGEQRRLYDERRRTELPKHGVILLEFDYSEFGCDSRKRLLRQEKDIEIVKAKLKKILSVIVK